MDKNKSETNPFAMDYKAVIKAPKVQVNWRNKKTGKYEVDKLYNVMEGL